MVNIKIKNKCKKTIDFRIYLLYIITKMVATAITKQTKRKARRQKMEITRKNLVLKVNNTEISDFSYKDNPYRCSLKDVAKMILEEYFNATGLRLEIQEFQQEYCSSTYVTMNGVRLLLLAKTDYEHQNDISYLDINKTTKIAEIKQSIEALVVAIQEAVKKAQTLDFEVEVKINKI